MTKQPLSPCSGGCHDSRKEEHGLPETDPGTKTCIERVYLGGARNTGVEWENATGTGSQLPLWVDELNPNGESQVCAEEPAC